ncbi:cytochrome c biogenesis protein ResB [Aneurinibacillus terranovensis]|uniref:cytochrome c biogenesis protein ResB n=1 Tax=Aneurinibacillus terranovensis TaxID=278991 RepID=UPI000413448E|nr:cytochrome c biogenesis protein ResB [Aneurinibacillus terranovensis]
MESKQAESVKCECGHANPVGTVLCESCGVPLNKDAEDSQIDMRYEGAARRSQIYSRTIVDQVWNFFSSVKIAVVMIVITLIASAIGTIFPQENLIAEPPEIYYPHAYGTLGEIYYRLGLSHMYDSWWFVSLLLAIGISLVVCSIDRAIPLYRALRLQKVKRNKRFLQLQKVSTEFVLGQEDEQSAISRLEAALKNKRYKVRREANALLGEKNRFSRWGPYINHIGLIIFLIGCLMRLIPGDYLDQFVWVREGQTVKLPETNYYVKNEKFDITYYQQNEFPQKLDMQGVIPKEYRTRAVLYEDQNAGVPGAEPKLKEVHKQDVLVNHPFEYQHLLLYQSGEQQNQLEALNLAIVDTSTQQQMGTIKLDLYNPPDQIKINDKMSVRVLQYFPDFTLDENTKQPATKSKDPNNPAFILDLKSPKTPNGEKVWVFLGRIVTADGKNPVMNYQFLKPDLVDVSGLLVRIDRSLPVIYFGCFICMIGLIMGFYWQHRRIWLQLEDGKMYVAAHTNKNWYGIKNEVVDVLKAIDCDIAISQLDKKEGKTA